MRMIHWCDSGECVVDGVCVVDGEVVRIWLMKVGRCVVILE
jgi:hypothetical protein